MAEDMVRGDGWISDDSSFYGSDDEKKRQTDLVRKPDASQFWRTHDKDMNVIMKAARTQLLTDANGTVKPGSSSNDASISKKGKTDSISAMHEQVSNIHGLKAKDAGQEAPATSGKRKRESSPELELFNPLQGCPDAWQLGESVDDFVRRLPPTATSESTCPWIRAENPHRDPRDQSPCPRVDDFVSRGMEILEQSLKTRRKIQNSSASKPRGTMTRELNQESKSLKERIALLAQETNLISGKWMLFPKPKDVTKAWKQIVGAVIDNRLGTGCKIATDNGNEERLLCVYTKNFQDTQDVRRVLKALEEMGVLPSDKVIYYKADAYTYLDIRSQTAVDYGLQASLYNSRTMLAHSRVSQSAPQPQKKQSALNRYILP